MILFFLLSQVDLRCQTFFAHHPWRLRYILQTTGHRTVYGVLWRKNFNGHNKGNGMDLTEAKDIKKRWQEYTEELYKKELHDPDNHDGVITHNLFHGAMYSLCNYCVSLNFKF